MTEQTNTAPMGQAEAVGVLREALTEIETMWRGTAAAIVARHALASTERAAIQPAGEVQKALDDAAYWDTGMMIGGRHVPYADTLAARSPVAAPDAEAIRSALKFIHDTFKRDMDQGFRTKDKEFAVSIAAQALSQSSPAVKSAEPNFIDAQITNKAIDMYRAMVDSSGVHGNRFPAWRLLSQDEQNGWKHQARSALASAKSAEPTGGAA